MEFGLWVEPEMVNPDSDLFRAHPDWILASGGRVFAFVAGAGLSLPLATSAGYLAFFVPAVCVLTAAGLSFMPEWWAQRQAETAPEMEEAKV